jgi:thiol-disulfide isomerase/thioredoxin
MDKTLPEVEDTENISYQELPPDPQPTARSDSTKAMLGVVIVLLVGVLVLQFLQLRAADDVRAEVSALTEDVTDLKPLRRDVDILGDQMASLDGQIQAAVSAAGASPAAIPTQPADGSLPAFQDSANDPAVLGEMTLSEISAEEYYSAGNATFAPDDGKARVWMVWAHWCPYCQAELPDLSTWYPENAARFPNVELVTITSAIDDTQDNPLIPYLDAEQFPFPVLVDESGQLSQKLGTTAFPFWVVTDAEGTVVLRVAGALGISSIDQIFAQLETMSNGS